MLPFYTYLSPSLITSYDHFMWTLSEWGVFNIYPFLHGLKWEARLWRCWDYLGRTEILNLLLLMAKAPQEFLFQKEHMWLALVPPYHARRSIAREIYKCWNIGRQDGMSFITDTNSVWMKGCLQIRAGTEAVYLKFIPSVEKLPMSPRMSQFQRFKK